MKLFPSTTAYRRHDRKCGWRIKGRGMKVLEPMESERFQKGPGRGQSLCYADGEQPVLGKNIADKSVSKQRHG